MASLSLPQESKLSLFDRWHSGERKVQDLLHVREAVKDHSSIFRPNLTLQMQDFVSGLNYFFMGTLDSSGRPWVSILTGPKGFMQSPDSKTLEIKTRLDTNVVRLTDLTAIRERGATTKPDPLFSNLVDGERFKGGKRMWGGVALDFTNRRRNKINGVLYPEGLLTANESSGELHLRLTVEQTIGNCPKYITIRELDTSPITLNTEEPASESGSEASKNQEYFSKELDDEEQAVIRQADCLFISSRFIDETLADQTSGMDCNHRGGNPGFVRIMNGNRLVFPDYSGNRALYPHAQRCVQVTFDSGHLLRRHVLPFRMHTKEISPYNPILPSSQNGIIVDERDTSRILATLTDIKKHTADISSFHFKTSRPIQYTPGQYAVLDFGEFNMAGYRHMADDDPQSLNDDFIRTWTISSAPKPGLSSSTTLSGESVSSSNSEFALTIKRKPGGVISNLLHGLDMKRINRPFVVPVLSIVFISGGIGSTPFISMIRGLRHSQVLLNSSGPIEIQWIISVPYFEDALPEILQEVTAPLANGSLLGLTVKVFLTRGHPEDMSSAELDLPSHRSNVHVRHERLSSKVLLSAIPDLAQKQDYDRQFLLCGPEPFMEAVKGYLHELGVPPALVHTEDFNY
ncbi:hypothetical protein EDD11_008808 [Mortierella claussenii]|nr:hypothetical protein EDD11_008808 [Mortierella claussenii]